jgi:pSer/pThr/pTyr-binding forkhead associated (FHA) protein
MAARPDDPGPTPREIQERLWAERTEEPFLIYRDGEGRQVIHVLGSSSEHVTIGRRPDNDVALTWDDEVSRVHAQLERVGGEWVVVDDGLSRNGTFVNGEQTPTRRRVTDGDRIVVGETALLYRAPSAATWHSTVSIPSGRDRIPVTPAQRQVLVGLCRPLKASAYAAPATNREIAEELHLSVDAVKAHLRVLFDRFGLEDLPQNQKRARLAAMALVDKLVNERDF